MNNFNNNKIEFREIVLSHIQRILELTSHELRNGTHTVSTGKLTDVAFEEDTRIAYTQMIENLSYILLPYFDEEMQGVYDTSIKVMNAFRHEIKDLCKTEYDAIAKALGDNELQEDFFREMKIQHSKKLFTALNLLLKRNGYLKSTIYEDNDDDLAEVPEEEE